MINPAVRLRAELSTDNLVTDKTLRDIAAAYGLPLYVPDPAQTERRQSMLELVARLERRLAEAEAAGFVRTIEVCRREYEAARAALVGDGK
jgi:hypothetical protein